MSSDGEEKKIIKQVLEVTQDCLKLTTSEIFPTLLKGEDVFLAGMDLIWLDVSPRFEDAKKHVDDSSHDDLASVGLTGNELSVKANWIQLLWDRLRRVWHTRGDKIIKILKALFAATNSFLESLASKIPGVDPIKEFKGYLEAGLELA